MITLRDGYEVPEYLVLPVSQCLTTLAQECLCKGQEHLARFAELIRKCKAADYALMNEEDVAKIGVIHCLEPHAVNKYMKRIAINLVKVYPAAGSGTVVEFTSPYTDC